MTSHKIYNGKGFTLIEVLIVVGIFVVLVGLGLGVGSGTYSRSYFNADREAVLRGLYMARSRAMNNIDQVPHGVRIDEEAFIIFRGSRYDSRDSLNEEINLQSSKLFSSSTEDIIFSQLEGSLDLEQEFRISDGVRENTIMINYEGGINWE